jgi:hypothetical protein
MTCGTISNSSTLPGHIFLSPEQQNNCKQETYETPFNKCVFQIISAGIQLLQSRQYYTIAKNSRL